MIPVRPEPEYPEFDSEVRRPGRAFLKNNPHPSNRDFRSHAYWRKAAGHLKAAYSSLCAYTSLHLVDVSSVDHFRPKTKYPNLAYEWSNYRLARQKINQRKGDAEDVIDPFQVKSGWFVLDLPSCLIRPGDGLNQRARDRVNATIATLKLNADDHLVQERCDWLTELAQGEVTLNFLNRRYPFLAVEVRRQGVEDRLSQIFRRRR